MRKEKIDLNLIGILKKQVEEKINQGDSSKWTQRDFEYLSEIVFGETRISLSVSTLKRLWKDEKNRLPHQATLDALAKFVGYSAWNDFKTQNNVRVSSIPIRKRKSRSGLLLIFSVIFILFCIVALYVYFKTIPDKKTTSDINPEQFSFSIKKNISYGIPNSVVFSYDLSQINCDSAFIQQSWDPRRREKIDKNNNFHTSIYYFPGYFTAKLIVNNEIVKELPLHIVTKYWEAFYRTKWGDNKPVHINIGSIFRDRNMVVSTDLLKQNKITPDLNQYFVTFYNYKDFGNIFSDNFSLETSIKNDQGERAFNCHIFYLGIQFETGFLSVPFSDLGCTSIISLYLGNKSIKGKTNDLSMFGCNMSEWKNLKIELENKELTVNIDNNKIYTDSLSLNKGKIVGMQYSFLGCGVVDYVQLFNENDSLIYNEDFK